MNFHISAQTCRAREAHHRQIAVEAVLPNVRKVAVVAAEAWARQAEEAEAIEAGGKPPLTPDDAAMVAEFQREDNRPTAR
ncbi:hypothetical protein WG901_22180 [Novosphingobium sp. PS1R-30]|uniref:CopG family transcriptional regulator n=1 Tax=Novosphingobium anseongense TaxID=3133436 RepID=A0ABU8S1Y6_9SPHN